MIWYLYSITWMFLLYFSYEIVKSIYGIKLWVIYRFVTGFCVLILYTDYMISCIVSLFNSFFFCILKGIKWYHIEMIWYFTWCQIIITLYQIIITLYQIIITLYQIIITLYQIIITLYQIIITLYQIIIFFSLSWMFLLYFF